MRTKFHIEFIGECDFETLKREFNLPAIVPFNEAAEYIKKEFLNSDKEKIMNLTIYVNITKL